MPIYDYVCTSCRHRFEVFHGLNETGPHQCPLCGSPVTRVFAPPAIVFKGSGWAKVDRRYSGAPSKKPAEPGATKGSDGGSKESPASTGAGTGSGSSGDGGGTSGSSKAAAG